MLAGETTLAAMEASEADCHSPCDGLLTSIYTLGDSACNVTTVTTMTSMFKMTTLSKEQNYI